MASAINRFSFYVAIEGFLKIANDVSQDQLDVIALGSFSIRDLLGHISRALSTIENYIIPSIHSESRLSAVDYFTSIWEPPNTQKRILRDKNICERAQTAALNLGRDIQEIKSSLSTLALRVKGIVTGATDDAAVNTPLGQMQLIEYLPTRTFELVVHSLDLAKVTNIPIPDSLQPAIESTLMLALQLVIKNNEAPELLLAICGRHGLPEGYSVV